MTTPRSLGGRGGGSHVDLSGSRFLLLRILRVSSGSRRSAAFTAYSGDTDVRATAAAADDLAARRRRNGEDALAAQVRAHDSDDVFVAWH